MLLIFALYANLRWANQSPAFEKAKQTADTPAYMRIAGEAVTSKMFWVNTRPPVFPLILKLYDADKVKVAEFQTAFSIFAWGMLALAIGFSIKNIFVLRPVAFSLILVLSLERHIAGWDVVLLTESISISLMALFLASWFWLQKKWSWWIVTILSIIAFFWAFARDTNGWMLLMVAGLILMGVVFFGGHKRNILLVAIFSLIFTLSNLSADGGNRWVFPFQNVLAQRILPDSNALTFFEKCGMPVTPELLNLAGGYANSGNRAFYNDPALEPYRTWLQERGKLCLMQWLLSRPFSSLREPWNDIEVLLAFEDVSIFHPQRYMPILPWYVEKLIYPQYGSILLWGLMSMSVIIIMWKRVWNVNPAWVIVIGLCILIYPHIFIIWHGDVPGTHRHALTVSLQYVLCFWLFILFGVERFFSLVLQRAQKQ